VSCYRCRQQRFTYIISTLYDMFR